MRHKFPACIQRHTGKIIIFSIVLIIALFAYKTVYLPYSISFGGQVLPIIQISTNESSTLRAEFGQLGDYFGGLLNPIFGFASFLALLATILYQSTELKLSRNELELTRKEIANSSFALNAQNKAIELQSFEQTFFAWLSTYRDLINTISTTTPPQNRIVGKEALYNLLQHSLSDYAIFSSMCVRDNNNFGQQKLANEFNNSYRSTFYNHSSYKKVEIIATDFQGNVAGHIHKQWSYLYYQNEYQLDSLFRTGYKLISWIDGLPEERLTKEQKWLYVSIFRSQLSWVEMVFFYYNGLAGTGEKFKALIEKYALFDNLTFDSDIGIKVLHLYFDRNSYYKPSAFNSDRARNIL
ncbi:putative phage abortive infection protein [Methylophilus sp. OH31]|uniref:putative phage abortive infection protein n=1 Tax=Methylophilus sp. OH31 TaxID=1387312 RepID=UPI000467E22A|nr:putative phage abortive infection protein [Methylophilus sp. OH31]